MAIHEHERRVIKIESQRDSSFVCSIAFDSSLDFDGLKLMNILLTVASDKHHDMAAKHNFLQHTYVVEITHAYTSIKPIFDMLFPSLHTLLIPGF